MAYVGTYRALLAGGVSRPALVLDFIGLNVLDTRITFSRGSNATLVDSTGKITYAPANLLLWSEAFDNITWVKTNSAVSASGAFWKLVGNSGQTDVRLQQGYTVTTNGLNMLISVYAREDDARYMNLGRAGAGVWFDLRNGSVLFSSAGFSGASSTPDTNGFRRYYVSVLETITNGTSTQVRIYPSVNTPTSSLPTSGGGNDGVKGILVDFVQLEPVTYQTTPSTYQATTSSAYYGPRFDYDPVTLAAKGLLIEEQRTNYALYSHDLTNAAWTATTMSTAKTATGPDGVANSATTITASAGNATILQAITDASNARITSCYIKRRTGTGTVEMTQDNGSTWAAVTVTASWTRVSIASATLANPTIGLRIVTNGDAVDVWGFQNERGAFVTSVIPTTASTATRSADVATMTGANFSSWYNSTAGTFVVGFDSAAPSTKWVLAVTDGTANNYIGADIASAGNVRYRVLSGGVTQCSISSTATLLADSAVRLAFTYATNSFQQSLDGVLGAADTSGTVPTVNQLRIAFLTGVPGTGHIRSIAYYNVRLPNAQLVQLTS